MPFLDRIKDTVTGVLPQKRSQTLPTSLPGGIGSHYGANWKGEDLMFSKSWIVAAALEIFFSFIAMCCFASVASFQAKHGVGPSSLSGFAIFASIFSIFLAAFLLAVPILNEKRDILHGLARALREIRVGLIATSSGAFFSLLPAFITTISAFTQAGCKNAESDPSAEEAGEDFVAGLPDWCRTKKAGAFFFWFALIAWLFAVWLVFNEWRRPGDGSKVYRERAQDPPFQRPQDTGVTAHTVDDDRDEPFTRPNNRYDDPHDHQSPFADNSRYGGPVAGRPSTDAYGAFSDPTPTGYGDASPVSRTMQYADADPYSRVQRNIHQDPTHAGSVPPSYDHGYTGYRG